MAQHSSKRNRKPRNAKTRRRRRVFGLGTTAGAVLAAAMTPLATAPTAPKANADIIDLIIDPIIQPLMSLIDPVVAGLASSADPALGTLGLPSDPLAGVTLPSLPLDPAAGD
ncbi:MAG TPA: hypothetical protein VEF72_08395 [Mycobacterium sp.]|nr:hypothetical protein [Mycobacterium sp.]